jgi:NADH-quinone oxidoreductase subunit D
VVLKRLVSKAFELLDTFLVEFPVAWKNLKTERNRIFIDRTVNVGAITAEQAMAYGFTGPNYVLLVLIMMCV